MKKYITPKNIAILAAIIVLVWLLWPKAKAAVITDPSVPPSTQGDHTLDNFMVPPSSQPISDPIAAKQPKTGSKKESLMNLETRMSNDVSKSHFS